MGIEVSLVAVLVAAIFSMFLGFLWYSPLLFGKPWIKLMGYTEESLNSAQKKMGIYYLISFILSLVTAYILAIFIPIYMDFIQMKLNNLSIIHNTKIQAGISISLLAWAGFVMPVQATTTIFSVEKKWALFTINTGYQLVSLIGMSIVIAVI